MSGAITDYERRIWSMPFDAILSPYCPTTWWTPEGRSRAVRRLERRGFPTLKGWLAITLTIDPEKFGWDHVTAYESGKDRVRRVVAALRAAGFKVKRYFSKLEVQVDTEMAHWHIGLDTRSFVAAAEIEALWGLGFVKVQRVQDDDWRYLFKYVVKGSAIPQWIRDYPKRIRVFQTSVGFFSADQKKKSVTEEEKPEKPPGPVETLGSKLDRWTRTGVVRVRSLNMKPFIVRLLATYQEIFVRKVFQAGPCADVYHLGLDNLNAKEIICRTRINPRLLTRLNWTEFSSAA